MKSTGSFKRQKTTPVNFQNHGFSLTFLVSKFQSNSSLHPNISVITTLITRLQLPSPNRSLASADGNLTTRRYASFSVSWSGWKSIYIHVSPAMRMIDDIQSSLVAGVYGSSSGSGFTKILKYGSNMVLGCFNSCSCFLKQIYVIFSGKVILEIPFKF